MSTRAGLLSPRAGSAQPRSHRESSDTVHFKTLPLYTQHCSRVLEVLVAKTDLSAYKEKCGRKGLVKKCGKFYIRFYLGVTSEFPPT